MTNLQHGTSYLPAKYRCYKSGSFIEYYVENPQTNKLHRKTIKVNRIIARHKYKKDALKHIDEMVRSINIKLSTGYNPFFDGEDSRLYVPMRDVFEQYLMEKSKECRPDTMRSYQSFVSQFTKYIAKNSTVGYISMVTHALVAKYLDHCYNVKNNSARTYNNQIKMGRAFFNWCIEKYYTKGNPFDKIKTKKKKKKKRIIIDVETRKKITDYLQDNNKNFLTICKLIYYSLIRPKEILMIKIEDINLEKHYIFIPSENAKTHNERFAALTPDLVAELAYIADYPKNYYLFSDKYLPGKRKKTTSALAKEWSRLRNKLKLDKNMQLYSFRDTGINAMLKCGIDDLSVMQHADHSSLEMTTLYANHYDEGLTQRIYENAPKF
jgi:integrase